MREHVYAPGILGMPYGAMRERLAVSLVLAALLSATPSIIAAAQPVGTHTILDPGGRFSISFPTEWQVETSASGKPAVIGAGPNQPGEFRINVNVVVEALPAAMSAQDFAVASEPALRTIFHEFTVAQEGPAQIGGRAAYYRYYTWRTNTGVSVYQIQVYLTTEQTGFVMTGSTINDPARLRTDLPVLARIIESFRLAGAPPSAKM